MFETLKRALFAARVCIVATPPCDLRWHKHQQKGHRKFCSGLPGAMLTTPFTNSARKRRSFSDANSWRSYEQCLFFSCFVCCVHVNRGVRMNVRMPVGFDSTALSFFNCLMSLCLMGSTFPSFLTSACIDHFQDSLLTTLNATLFWMFGPFGARTPISTKTSKHLGGLDRAKVCQDCAETIQRIANLHHIFTTRSTVKN